MSIRAFLSVAALGAGVGAFAQNAELERIKHDHTRSYHTWQALHAQHPEGYGFSLLRLDRDARRTEELRVWVADNAAVRVRLYERDFLEKGIGTGRDTTLDEWHGIPISNLDALYVFALERLFLAKADSCALRFDTDADGVLRGAFAQCAHGEMGLQLGERVWADANARLVGTWRLRRATDRRIQARFEPDSFKSLPSLELLADGQARFRAERSASVRARYRLGAWQSLVWDQVDWFDEPAHRDKLPHWVYDFTKARDFRFQDENLILFNDFQEFIFER